MEAGAGLCKITGIGFLGANVALSREVGWGQRSVVVDWQADWMWGTREIRSHLIGPLCHARGYMCRS